MPALSDLAAAQCVPEESATNDREAYAIFAVLELGNLDCDNPTESAAAIAPVSDTD